MKNRFFKKTQAMIELAILGPILLAAVGIVVTYVNKLNNDQWILMSAFRNALAKAHDTNNIVHYTTYDDRPLASANAPILGQAVGSSAGASAHWAIRDVSEGSSDNTAQPENYLKINGGAIPGLYEYRIEEMEGIESSRFVYDRMAINVNMDNQQTVSSRSAGRDEVIIYKVGSQIFVQARSHGGRRIFRVKN